MRIIAVAEPKRRTPGSVGETVADFLKRAARPMSGHAIAHDLAVDGYRVMPSQIFRTLKQLCGQKTVHRIELLRGFAAGPPCEAINLVCDSCRSLEVVPSASVFRDLQELAENHGFKMHAAIAESTGLCDRCKNAGSCN